MITGILKATKKYFNTLDKVGTINPIEGKKLQLMNGVYKIYLRKDVLGLTNKDLVKLNTIIDCITKNSCVFKGIPKNLLKIDVDTPQDVDDINGIITHRNENVITILGGERVVSTSNQTRTFSSFAYSPELGDEDFLVGYDSDTQAELRVEASKVFSIWLED